VFCFTIVSRQPLTAAVALDTSKAIVQRVTSELRIDGVTFGNGKKWVPYRSTCSWSV